MLGVLVVTICRFLQPENAYDAFALFVRTVNSEFARFYGASFADILNVAAFTCVRTLGAVVDIPEACDAADIALKVCLCLLCTCAADATKVAAVDEAQSSVCIAVRVSEGCGSITHHYQLLLKHQL